MPIPVRNPIAPAPKIALVASIAWSLWNYRLSLIRALEQAGYEVILLAAEDASCAQIEQHTSAQFFPLHQLSRSSLSGLQNLKFLFEMHAALRRQKPDVVLFFTIRPNTLGNFAAALAGVPSISTVEGMGISGSTSGWLSWLTPKLYRWAFRHTHKVILLNKDDQQELIQQGIVKAEKTLLTPGPGIDLQHFSPRPKSQTSEKIVFLFVARLLAEKGIREFVAAAKNLKARGVAAEFRVLGAVDPGNPSTILETELQTWVSAGIIQHLGFQTDVRPAIADSDVLVLPSYYREGLPRSVLEAMAMGKPILTTQSIGCRETVVEGENGLLIPPRDLPALEMALQKFVDYSPEQRAEMGQKSRLKVAAEFGDAQVIPEYLRQIEAILQAKTKFHS